MSNFVLQYVHKTSVSVPSTSFRNGNSSRNAGLNFVLVLGIALSKIFDTTDSRIHSRGSEIVCIRRSKKRERSERKIYKIEEIFELQEAKFSCYPENPAFGGFSGFSVPIWGTGGIDSKRGTIPPDWGRMASLDFVMSVWCSFCGR
jgi:hypothetical protein